MVVRPAPALVRTGTDRIGGALRQATVASVSSEIRAVPSTSEAGKAYWMIGDPLNWRAAGGRIKPRIALCCRCRGIS